MRFVIAAALYLTGLILALVGVAQQTIWLPPLQHHMSIQASGNAPLLILDHKALTQFPGDPEVRIDGDSQIFMATGREEDVKAWVGATTNQLVSAAPNGKKLTASLTTGIGLTVNPAGSDLWRTELAAQTSLTQTVDVSEHAAVLLANDGLQAAPTNVHLVWNIQNDTFWSRVYFFGGLGFILAGIIANAWAWYHMRKHRGPRRRTPRAPQGPKYRYRSNRSAPSRGRRAARNSKIATVGFISLAVLAGCAPTSSPSATPSATSSVASDTAPPVVTAPQLAKIVSRISVALSEGDTAKDSKLLANRVSGPALDSRAAHYALQRLNSKIAPLPGIDARNITFLLPAASVSWPRVVMTVVSASGTDSLPQMLVLEQAAPRAQYNLWYQIDMLPGVKTPEVAAAASGAIPVAADSKFLKVSPNALPSAFGNLIDLGQASLSASSFDVSNDEFYKQVASSQSAQRASLKDASIAVEHSLGNSNVLALATSNTGALVAVYMKDTYTIKPTKKNSAVAVSGNEKLLLGATGSAKGIRSVYGDMLLFYVPAISSSDRIMTLGASQGLLGIRSL